MVGTKEELLDDGFCYYWDNDDFPNNNDRKEQSPAILPLQKYTDGYTGSSDDFLTCLNRMEQSLTIVTILNTDTALEGTKVGSMDENCVGSSKKTIKGTANESIERTKDVIPVGINEATSEGTENVALRDEHLKASTTLPTMVTKMLITMAIKIYH